METPTENLKKKENEKSIWDSNEILAIVSSAAKDGTSRDSAREGVIEFPIDYIDLPYLGNWTPEFIAKAGKMMRKDPIRVVFYDHEEMRKVYLLIYDVIGYKHVLMQALNEVNFYSSYPELKEDEKRVWLILFEMYTRHFAEKTPEDMELENKLYTEADLSFISKCLWELRVTLARTMSRIRVKKGALTLAHSLPESARERLPLFNSEVNGWMNPYKVKDKEEAQKLLESAGLLEAGDKDASEGEVSLLPSQFKWDKVCPLLLKFSLENRTEFMKSKLIKENLFIIQDKEFAVGPAFFSRLPDFYDLEGNIIQTHATSMESVAYLACLLRSVTKIRKFFVFSVGEKINEYENYMKKLGVDNIHLFSEKFTKLNPESSQFEDIVGIFATPPNSYSGLADPIDLVCTKDENLHQLEILKESEMKDEGKKKAKRLLDEQKETLGLCMAGPHVQFILYETHSIIGTENKGMIKYSIEDANNLVFGRYLDDFREEKRKNASSTKTEDKTTNETRPEMEDYSLCFEVPPTEEFHYVDIPDVCFNQDRNFDIAVWGCYMSLVQRKKITKICKKAQ